MKRRFWIKRNILVAMKQLYDEKNFIKEESQLALVKSLIDEDKKKNQNERYYNHIITIFGKTTGKYPNGLRRNQMLQSCIVMEYANSKCLHDRKFCLHALHKFYLFILINVFEQFFTRIPT